MDVGHGWTAGATVAPDGRTGGAPRAHGRTHVTKAQAAVYDSFMRTRSMSETARELGLSQIRVREALVQCERNLMRDRGLTPPPLGAMLKGDVTTRFGVSRDLLQGRPAKHRPPTAFPIPATPAAGWRERPDQPRVIAAPARGVRRLIVTGAEGGAPAHGSFVANLRAYAAHLGAELIALRSDHEGLGPVAAELAPFATRRAIDVAGQLDLRPDIHLPRVARAPLDRIERASPGRWSAFAHPMFQLQSLLRLRGQRARVQLTTGTATIGRDGTASEPPGALVVEACADGARFVRPVRGGERDGTFHDLDARVANGTVATGRAIEALVLGDIHHARMDPAVARATWGDESDAGLVGRVRPRVQVMHDVVDFLARNPHDRVDPHARYLRHATGTGDVRREMEAAAAFLGGARRPWGRVVVVHSNHDLMLARWLRETDHRLDPENAAFYLDRQAAMLARLRAGVGDGSFLAETLRDLHPDGLDGVRFLADSESLAIAGVECGIHGHAGADGARGSFTGLERLGVDMVVGHGHRPTAAGGIYMVGVCQLDMGYNRGPTTWAVAHVVVHADGARQHVFMDGGRFAA